MRQGADGRITRQADVARIEQGARNQDTECRLDGRPAVIWPVFQLPGSNALQTADRIRAKMQELEKSFPKGIKYAIAYDTTPFIDESVHEVFKTLRDAVVLVAIVVLLSSCRIGSRCCCRSSMWPCRWFGTFAVNDAAGLFAEQPDAVRLGTGESNCG